MKFEIGTNAVKLGILSVAGTLLVSGLNLAYTQYTKKKYIKKLRAGIALCDAYIEERTDLSEEDVNEIRNAQSELMIKLLEYV